MGQGEKNANEARQSEEIVESKNPDGLVGHIEADGGKGVDDLPPKGYEVMHVRERNST